VTKWRATLESRRTRARRAARNDSSPVWASFLRIEVGAPGCGWHIGNRRKVHQDRQARETRGYRAISVVIVGGSVVGKRGSYVGVMAALTSVGGLAFVPGGTRCWSVAHEPCWHAPAHQSSDLFSSGIRCNYAMFASLIGIKEVAYRARCPSAARPVHTQSAVSQPDRRAGGRRQDDADQKRHPRGAACGRRTDASRDAEGILARWTRRGFVSAIAEAARRTLRMASFPDRRLDLMPWRSPTSSPAHPGAR